MGGGSSSNKSSNTTNNIDESVNLNAGGYVAQDGSSINMLDGGAIEDAFNFGGLALVESMDLAEQNINVLAKSNSQSVDAVKELAENLKANTTETEQTQNKIDNYFIYGFVLLLVILLFVALRGKK